MRNLNCAVNALARMQTGAGIATPTVTGPFEQTENLIDSVQSSTSGSSKVSRQSSVNEKTALAKASNLNEDVTSGLPVGA